MTQPQESGSHRRELILSAAIPVFGRLGFKKTTVDDLAEGAQISKQGLYLHFTSKEHVFLAAMQKYLDDGLVLVQKALTQPNTPLFDRLLGAMDAWFGRHLAIFTPQSFDIFETGDRLSGKEVEEYKIAFQAKLAKAMAESEEFEHANNICTAKEVAQVLFLCGLTWKDRHGSRAEFVKKIRVCIKAICQIHPGKH
jgi:AcrR family transcriptional regulator